MPNDEARYFKQNLPRIEKFFSQVAELVIEFVAEHNLLLDKYPHNLPWWELRFAHSRDGEASITIKQIDDNMLSVSGIWIIDSYDEFVRYIKSSAPTYMPISKKDLLIRYLNKEFDKVLD